MIRSLVLAAAVASLALPAAADQLARSLGVPPGVFTTAELMLMREALQDNDLQRYGWVADRTDLGGSRVFLRDWGPGAQLDAAPAPRSSAADMATSMGIDRDDA